MNEAIISDGSRHPLATVVSPANLVTLARLLCSPILFLFILNASENRGVSWWSVVLGFVLAVSDILDGLLARRRESVSRWGAFLDPFADKVVVVGAAFCLVNIDRFHLLPVLLLTVREFGITGYRLYFASKGLSIPARNSAKWKTTVQGVALMLAVLPPLENIQWVVDAGLWTAVTFTIFTGFQYLFDGSRAASTTGQ
tara:strand:- start:92 stop:685 length:594 start_codon:yes stop_codon:yes gene_type:complete